MKFSTLAIPTLLAAGLSFGMAPAVQAHDLNGLLDRLYEYSDYVYTNNGYRNYGYGDSCRIAGHYGDNCCSEASHRHRHDGKDHWYRGDGRHHDTKHGHHHKDGHRHGDKHAYRHKDGRRHGYDDGHGKSYRKDRPGKYRADGRKRDKRHDGWNDKRRNRS